MKKVQHQSFIRFSSVLSESVSASERKLKSAVDDEQIERRHVSVYSKFIRQSQFPNAARINITESQSMMRSGGGGGGGGGSTSTTTNSRTTPDGLSSGQRDSISQQHNQEPMEWTHLFTGSAYSGQWNQFGFSGHGLYRFSDGLLYDGHLRNGHFHGSGQLIFENGNRIKGFWQNGVNKHMKFVFADGLEFEPNDWPYCLAPADRRYGVAELAQQPPVGEHFVLPPHHQVPRGCYMTVDGYYDPRTQLMHHVAHEAHRSESLTTPVAAAEAAWIVENCARADRSREEEERQYRRSFMS